ncbi:MAG: hypothetical protein ACLFVK_04170 [Dehalococcoidia bacterium]
MKQAAIVVESKDNIDTALQKLQSSDYMRLIRERVANVKGLKGRGDRK